MNQDVVVNLSTTALTLAFKVAMPMLAAGLIVGLVVSIFQAVTQIQEQTLAFIPKVIALAAVLMLLGPWMLNQMLTYTADLWGGIPRLVG
ncbi:MAG: flagellar biosynthesis protein FliQ [Actinobacteria bacterium]|nr:MAG: flagellar biosynthesis protein FliQ [Actinomycetota bacterium]